MRAGAWGLASHWYAAPSLVSNLNATHAEFPDKHILHTEGCLCNAPSGGRVVLPGDPAWFALGESYGFGIMSVMQNHGEGFTDWNLILSAPGGGPFHERPFSCNAPMIQRAGELILQTPYYFMGQFSKFLVPGTRIVGAMHYAGSEAPQPLGSFVYQTALAASAPFGVLAGVTPNGTTVCIVLNAQDAGVTFKLKSGMAAGSGVFANVTVAAHSITTLSWA